MEIEIATIGGYEEVGRQMTAVRAGDDIVVFDMGLNLSKVLIHDNIRTEEMRSLDLIDMGAIPDDRVMSELDGEVQAIVPTHGHLDHIGAISKLAHRYDAPIVATPFTRELVDEEVHDESEYVVNNDLISMEAGESMQIGERCELEFVNVTHSIIDAINPVLHTPEGSVVYGLDKRVDHTPVIGDPIDMKRFREIGREDGGVLCYIEDCTNANRKGRTPSEAVARRQLRDVMRSIEDWDGGIVATTFSSHIARVKSIVEFAQDIGREPVLLGRSMEQYSGTAARLDGLDIGFPDDLGMYGHRKSVDRAFKRIMNEGKEKFLPVVTGHQGEPRAMLTRMGRGETPFELTDGDKVIFSARVIPEPTNEGQRYQSEKLLGMQGARIYDDVHVSGHLRQEGHYQMLDALQPQHVIPAHQDMKGFSGYVDLAGNKGYDLGRDLHVTSNGNTIQLV
ncbi:ribonuclease J [Halorientalis regularis]|uniref:Ribonuclease J n=1 Tax=Halorientalis regularis TaxID=660518 RepID=A0A1G7FGN5_9EURY|nr:ribonuclease J [Halorientalis regularis]SDE75061.1 ribonuclease J [Halorientalis regularis]